MSLRPLAALAFLLVALPSHAELVIDGPRKPAAQAGATVIAPAPLTVRAEDPAKRLPAGPVSYAKVDRVVETGGPRPADANDPVSGWADDVPLDLALSQVVPAGWSIHAQGVPGAKQVSWSGGRPWKQVLGDLAYRGDFAANIQWDNRRVVIYPAGQPAPAMDALAGTRLVRGQPTAKAPVASGVPCCAPTTIHTETDLGAGRLPSGSAAVVISPSPTPVAPARQWLIDPRLSLKQNVEAWTRQAGWSAVVWEAADYEMVAPAVFQGEFTSKDGPLAKLIAAYSKSDQPLQVELLTQDRVVHVTNKNYQPAVVAPMVPSQVAPETFNK